MSLMSSGLFGLDSDDHLDLVLVAQVQKFHGPFFGLYAYNCGALFGPQFCHAISLRKGAACSRPFYETVRYVPTEKISLNIFVAVLYDMDGAL